MNIGSLYIIKNNINDKVYIGKTYARAEVRFKEHIRDCKRFPDRPLYRAINKYGAEAFSLEVLGQYIESELELKEIEAIKDYKSYTDGYNATKGGDGKRYLKVSDSEILESYIETNNIAETSRRLKNR